MLTLSLPKGRLCGDSRSLGMTAFPVVSDKERRISSTARST